MDSDLSLLEISEEDDTLLPQMPSDEITSVKYLACSPLLRSTAPSRAAPLDCMMVDKHKEKANISSPSRQLNKENIKANEPDVSSSRNRSEQTKRRKKGGAAYNLRKSLAWNSAFFTDEGVLDPSELSMISGAFNKSSRGPMSIIQEEESNDDSSYLQPLEDHLCKELQRSTPNKGKGIGSNFSPKSDFSSRKNVIPTSPASRKVLSAHNANISGSKRGGYSRPLASASYKKPANSSTTKTVNELKIPKIPVPKPALRPLSATARSASLNNSIPGRALNAQKNVGFKATSNGKRNIERDIKISQGSKSSSFKPLVHRNTKDMAKSSKQMPCTSNLQSPQVAKISTERGLISSPKVQATASQALNPHILHTNVVPLNQNHPTENIQSVQQLPARKPSSLRMPSPSLGFFGQPKVSGTQSLLERVTIPSKPPESGIPKAQKLGPALPNSKLKPPRAPVKPLLAANDSAAASAVPSFMKSASQDTIKINMQKVNEKVSQKRMHKEHAVPSKIGSFIGTEEKQKEVNDEKIVANDEKIVANDVFMGSKDTSCEEMESLKLQLSPTEQFLDVSCINSMTKIRHYDQKNNISAKDIEITAETETQSRNDTSCSSQDVHLLKLGSNGVDVPSEHDKLVKSCLEKANQTSSEEKQISQTSESVLLQESRSSESFQEIYLENVSSNIPPQDREQENEMSQIDIETIKSQMVHPELRCLDSKISIESDNANLSTFSMDDQCLKIDNASKNSEEPSELQSPFLIKQDCEELNLSHFHGGKLNNIHIRSGVSPAAQIDDDFNIFFESTNLDLIMHNVDESSKTRLCITDQISQGGNQHVQAIIDNFTEEDMDLGEFRNFLDVSSQIQSPVEGELDTSQLLVINQANERAANVHEIIDKTHLGEEKMEALCGNQFSDNAECVSLKYSDVSESRTKDHHDYPVIVNDANKHLEDCSELKNPCSSFDGCVESKNIYVLEIGEASGHESGVQETMQVGGVANIERSASFSQDENIVEISIKDEVLVEDQPLLHQSNEEKNKLDSLSPKNSGGGVKHEAVVVKPILDAVPFSDEWLAAMEAAGEEILVMKTGAVQHSPTEKPVVEPSPWSPVKRKNNQGIGPFDCTKYTNNTCPNSD